MNGTKHPLKSKTIIGAIIALVAMGISTFLGYDVGAEDQAQLTEIVLGLLGSAGPVTAIYGRVKADKPVTLKK